METEEDTLTLLDQIDKLNLVINNLLQSGYGGRQTDNNGDTALIVAVKCGLHKVVHRILEHFNDIEINNTILSKPLHIGSRVEDSIFDEAICAKSNLIQIINKQDVNNKSALDYAVEKQNYDIACELLLHGANIGSLNREHQKALLLYSSKEVHKNSSALIDHRLRPVVALLSIKVPEAVINYSNDYEYPRLLSYFCYNGHSKVVASLIDSIRDTNRKRLLVNNPDNSSTPLNRANDNEKLNDLDRLQILQCLFERGASKTTNNVDPIYLTLETAALRGHMETFKYYANSAEGKDFNVYIGMAAVGNHLNLVKYLWENYCPSTATASGDTVLHYAGWKGKLPCVKYLCENGADVNCINDDGETPLDKAITHNTIDVVRCLAMEHNADVGPSARGISLQSIKKILCIQRGVNVNGDGLLHEAIKYGEMIFIRHLVTQGIDVNKLDLQGIPPLHLSAQKPDNDITKFLLQHGAYYDIRSSDNKSALHVSKYRNTIMLFTINVLFNSLDLFKDINTAIENNIKINDAYDQENLMVFLVSVKNSQRQTLLHKAVILNDSEAVRLLLKYNETFESMTESFRLPHIEDYVALDLYAQDSHGNTPLHFAAGNGNFGIVNMLLCKHPYLEIKNNAGLTAMFIAGRNGHADIVALMLEKSAKHENLVNQQAETEPINIKTEQDSEIS